MSNTTSELTVDANIDLVNRVKVERERFQNKTRWIFQLADLQEDIEKVLADILRISEQFDELMEAVHAVKQNRGLAGPEAKRLVESLYGEINKVRSMTKGARGAIKAVNQAAVALEELSDALDEGCRGLVRAKRNG